MADITTIEPSIFQAGDTVRWQKSLPDYPTSIWTLRYFINGPQQIVLTAIARGNDYLIEISASTSATWAAGSYWYEAVVERGTGAALERYKIKSGRLTIKPNPATLPAGYDGRSHVKKVLDALEATLQGKASRDQLSYTIEGRSIQKLSPAELVQWRNQYEWYYKQELMNERIAQGLKVGNKVMVRL